MLRKIRIGLAAVFFVCITLLFLDVTGSLHHWLGWMAKIQFIPAVLALNVVIIVALLLLTFVFGRVYCSVICPLGVFQDIVSWFGARHKKNRLTYSHAVSWLRYTILGLFVIALVAGIGSVFALLDPYGSFGRIASNLLQPLYRWGNNLLAYFAGRADSYMFYSVDVWIKSIGTFAVAAITFVVIAVLAWRNGRTYCNTFCPVGTFLGFISRFSLFKMTIDVDKCKGCRLCERNCKASCIDFKHHAIDYSRCVVCMDCIGNCHSDAIHYTFLPKSSKPKEAAPVKVATSETAPAGSVPTNARRSFLTASAIFAFGSWATAQRRKRQQVGQQNTAQVNKDGGIADIIPKKEPLRDTPIVPPGAQSIHNFQQHCTACQLCVSNCPNGVLRPSKDLLTFMQPVMSYERGYCRPECTTCSEVCPTGAIKLITKAQKSATKIGTAVWVKERCVVLRDGVDCHECERHCPTKAIMLVPIESKEPVDPASFGPFGPPAPLATPVVNAALCIGCGTCENLCPSRPLSAIFVQGIEVHRTI